MAQRVYVVEDDANIRELVRCALVSYGYEVEGFEAGEELIARISTRVPDLFLLDIMLPGMDGISLLRKIRNNAATSDIPVIMLTAKTSEIDKVKGLDAGANDYITKPFGILELSARVRAALRGREKRDDNKQLLVCGQICMDTARHTVTVDSQPVALTLKEYELLKILLQNAGKVVERERLLNRVWGIDFLGQTRTLDIHIRTLRVKLKDDADNPQYIETVRGVGYRLNEKQL